MNCFNCVRLGAAFCLWMGIVTSVSGQIVTNGTPYACEGSSTYARTNNESLDVTKRSLTCGLPTSVGHFFDLARDPELGCAYLRMTCVDFSVWSSDNAGPQDIFVRAYMDVTPDRRSDVCGSGAEPGPDTASLVLLEERTVTLPPSSEGVATGAPGRSDGDLSIEFHDGWWNPGLLIEPNTALFIEVGHLGEAITRFGTNSRGEAGDEAGGPEVTWVKAPICGGGGCITDDSGEWVKWSEFTNSNHDFVMQVHFELESRQFDPLPHCPEDIEGDDDAVGVVDLLALLSDWGTIQSCGHPRGDVAPSPMGDGMTNVVDMLALLAAWGPCPFSIQAAIDEASDGDEIVVPPGTYEESIDLRGKAITLRSEAGPDVTIIDGTAHDSPVVSCVSGEGPETVLDGFTITGGLTDPSPEPGEQGLMNRLGAGMRIVGSHPTIRNCVIAGNGALVRIHEGESRGGGVYVWNGQPSFTNCRFEDNIAEDSGGGVHVANASIRFVQCEFIGNFVDTGADAGRGGAVAGDDSTLTFEQCRFVSNDAWASGGGISLLRSSSIVDDCEFRDNWSGAGGAIWTSNGNTEIRQCRFTRNGVNGGLRSGLGGGIGSLHSDTQVHECEFRGNFAFGAGAALFNSESVVNVWNCIFVGNRSCGFSPGDHEGGGAVMGWGLSDDGTSTDTTLVNCTLASNLSWARGGGVVVVEGARAALFNCILWGNIDDGWSPEISEIYPDPYSTVALSHCIVDGGFFQGGTNVIDLDPLFVRNPDPGPDGVWCSDDDDYGDVHLVDQSPCFNAGDDAAFTFCPIDLDHRERFVAITSPGGRAAGTTAIIDLGAYELGGLPVSCVPPP